MLQTNPAGITTGIGYSKIQPFDGANQCFNQLQRQAQACPSRHYSNFFDQNSQQIADRCRGRNPNDYRTDPQGCRWENQSPAQTQIRDQTPTSATILAGNNRITVNKADSSVRIQNADGTEQNVDLKLWGDPHVNQNGREIGTIRNDVSFTLKDGTRVSLLMGDGNGGKPQPGVADYVDSAAIRSPVLLGVLMWELLMRLLFIAVGLFVVFALVDYGIQRFIFMREHRMSEDEVKRESKEQNGNPEVKQARRELAQELLNEEPVAGVARARLVVANPTHFAVAIGYERGGVPQVLAKGHDAVALAIRAEAERLDVPVIVNPPLARTLYKVALGGAIPRDCYQVVGLMLHWVEQLKVDAETRRRQAPQDTP